MPPPPTPHRTPLRRVSQGSLFRLSRSDQADPSAPYGLGFLDPALAELADEAEALYSNVEGLKQLGDSLEEFNESFASWLYVMNMNALTVDWPQVRTVDLSDRYSVNNRSCFMSRLQARLHSSWRNEEQVRFIRPLFLPIHESQCATEKDARAALLALQSHSPEKTTTTETVGDTTIGDNTMAETTVQSGTKAITKIIKKKGKPKLTAKEKKERSVSVIILTCLVLLLNIEPRTGT